MSQYKIFELENRAELPDPVCELPHSGVFRLKLVLCIILYVVGVNIISGGYSNSSWEKLWAFHTLRTESKPEWEINRACLVKDSCPQSGKNLHRLIL